MNSTKRERMNINTSTKRERVNANTSVKRKRVTEASTMLKHSLALRASKEMKRFQEP